MAMKTRGLPFIASALACRHMLAAVRWAREHHVALARVGGGLMVAVGVLLITGSWQDLVGQLQQPTFGYTSPV